MTRREYYRLLTAIFLILLWIALDTAEASPVLKTTSQLRKRGRRTKIPHAFIRWNQTKITCILEINEYDLVARVPPAPTTDENPTRKRDVIVSNPTSTVTVGDGGVSINNGGGGTPTSKSTGSEGLTTANKITIGLAIPGAVAGVVTLILAWKKCKNRRQKMPQANNAIEGVSVGTESKPRIVGYGPSQGILGNDWARP